MEDFDIYDLIYLQEYEAWENQKKGSKARIINYHLTKYQQNTYLILTHL